MKHLTLLEPIRKEGNYQFFMQWFADAWTTSGGQTVKGISVPWNLRFTEFPPVHQFTQGAAGAGSRLSGFIRVAVRLCK